MPATVNISVGSMYKVMSSSSHINITQCLRSFIVEGNVRSLGFVGNNIAQYARCF